MDRESDDLTMQDQGGPTGEPAGEPPEPTAIHDVPLMLDPTDAEIDAWAEQERRRREAWLSGPTAEERAAYARRERERRIAELLEEREATVEERERARIRRRREAQLVAEGAMSLLWRWSRRSLAELVRAGREWEEEFVQPPRRRRRVPFDDEAR
jgi:hypothetical protein